MTQTTSQSDRAALALLAAAKKRPAAAPDSGDVKEYDWQSPCRFTPTELERLRDFAARAAAGISSALGAVLHSDVHLESEAPVLRYADRLGGENVADACHVELMTGDGSRCGFVAVPPAMAREWVAKVLGGAGGGEGQELSPLESMLLMDVVSGATRAFCQAFADGQGGGALRCGRDLSPKPLLCSEDPTDEYATFSFRLSEDQADAGLRLVLLSDIAAVAAGAVDAPGPDRTPQQIRDDLQTYIDDIPVTSEVWLGSAELTMREIMDLEEGDVVLLETKTSGPIELTLLGKALLFGRLARSEGRYALQVVGLGSAGTQAGP